MISLRSDLPVTYIQHMGGDHAVVAAAKVSTNLEEAAEAWASETAEGRQGFIDFLVKNRHTSPLEHTVLTGRVEAPIFVFREWHRHRTQSYNEMSARYTKMLPEVYVAPPERPFVQVGKPGAYTFVPGDEYQHVTHTSWTLRAAETCWEAYEAQLDAGIAKELARAVLPVSLYSRMYFTVNLNNALKFLSLRTVEEDSLFPSYAQWEIEQCARQLEEIIATRIAPVTYASWVKARRF